MGAIVTEPIYYNVDPTLAEFFRRYHKASSKVCSVDTTITVPTTCEIFLGREGLGLAEDAILVKLTVPTPNSNREYIVPVPTAGPYTPPG